MLLVETFDSFKKKLGYELPHSMEEMNNLVSNGGNCFSDDLQNMQMENAKAEAGYLNEYKKYLAMYVEAFESNPIENNYIISFYIDLIKLYVDKNCPVYEGFIDIINFMFSTVEENAGDDAGIMQIIADRRINNINCALEKPVDGGVPYYYRNVYELVKAQFSNDRNDQ